MIKRLQWWSVYQLLLAKLNVKVIWFSYPLIGLITQSPLLQIHVSICTTMYIELSYLWVINTFLNKIWRTAKDISERRNCIENSKESPNWFLVDECDGCVQSTKYESYHRRCEVTAVHNEGLSTFNLPIFLSFTHYYHSQIHQFWAFPFLFTSLFLVLFQLFLFTRWIILSGAYM